MYCQTCGAQLRPGYMYCASCGAATGQPVPAPGGYIDRPLEGDASYRYAGFWRRFAAVWIDGLIVIAIALIPSILLAFLFYSIADGAQDPALTAADQQQRDDNNALAAVAGFILPWLIISFTYQVIATALGGVWGKRAMGIRIYRQGTRLAPGYGKAFLRVFFPVFLGVIPLVGGLLQLVDGIWLIFDADKQTWHDKVAGTVVAHHVASSPPIGASPPLATA